MVKYFKLDKNGEVPDFSFKNTEYWVDHDIRHIKDSLKWSIKVSPIILVSTVLLMILYAINNGWVVVDMLKFSISTFSAFFLTALFIRVLFYKGYSVGGRPGFSSEITQVGPFVSEDFDEKKLAELENKVGKLSKRIK